MGFLTANGRASGDMLNDRKFYREFDIGPDGISSVTGLKLKDSLRKYGYRGQVDTMDFCRQRKKRTPKFIDSGYLSITFEGILKGKPKKAAKKVISKLVYNNSRFA